MKTNKGLVEYANAQLGKPYWYGTFGQVADAELYAAKKKQYPRYYKSWNDFPTQYGERVHDCVGLIKGYLWSETADSKPKYNSSQDVSANGMRNACKEKGSIGTMPDIPGVLVFSEGHVGIYIGGGYVIEARGHEYGVVKTRLKSRPWRWWGKCPFIIYGEDKLTTRLTVKNGSWYVRSGIGTKYRALCIVKGGTVLTASAESGGWFYIERLGGWISGKAVTKH